MIPWGEGCPNCGSMDPRELADVCLIEAGKLARVLDDIARRLESVRGLEMGISLAWHCKIALCRGDDGWLQRMRERR